MTPTRSLITCCAPAIAFICASLTACSTASKKVELRAVPAAADVYAFSGEKLGTTPLILTKEVLSKNARSGRLAVKLVASGYAEKELILDIHGNDVHEITLSPFSPKYFSERLLKDYSVEANPMVREILRIQGLLVIRKLDEAEKVLVEFTKQYPSIAAGYLLSANIETLRGNPEKARGFLLRARSIDPNDPVVLRMLGPSQRSEMNSETQQP